MKKPRRKQSKPVRLAYLLIVLFLFTWIFFWGGNSFYKVWKQGREISLTQAKTNDIKASNDSLARNANRLRTDPSAAEEVAREEHGLIRHDEVVYRFKSTEADQAKKTETKKKH